MWRMPGRVPMTRCPKVPWSGELISVQPRVRLMRSFDERSHSYLGYVLGVRGVVGDDDREFLVAIGKAAQAKHGFRVGQRVRGESLPVADPRLETAEFYKTSGLRIVEEGPVSDADQPPWHGVPPTLEVCRERGHRRLDARTFTARCSTCMWGCNMSVEMIIDHWNPGRKRYRTETFCYGPLSCPEYRAGPERRVPGRKGMSYTEEDWVDEEETSHRGPDD